MDRSPSFRQKSLSKLLSICAFNLIVKIQLLIQIRVYRVMTTEGPHPESVRLGNRQIADGEIYSSKEEESSAFDPEISKEQLTMSNKKGFFHLQPSRTVNSVTVTTWSVVSSTFTSTFIPAADFLCVPPGYQICVP